MGDEASIAGVILAAGCSRRMGRPKALLQLQGRTLLGRVAATMRQGGLERLYVVIGAPVPGLRELAVSEGLVPIPNRDWRLGMLSSVQAAVRTLETDAPVAAMMLAPVDCPAFAVATVVALEAAFVRTRAPVVVPEHGGHRGHPVVFARGVWPELLVTPPQHGARFVVHAHEQEIVSVPVDDPYVLRDVDTPDQYRLLCADLAAGTAPPTGDDTAAGSN